MHNFELVCNDIKLKGHYFQKEGAKASVGIIHGFGEHRGRYTHVAKQFNKNNYNVFTIDLSGHGTSKGRRGDIYSMEQYLNEVDSLLDYMDRKASSLPKVLFGHSMGGLIAASYALNKSPNLSALVLSSPWFRLALKPNPIQLAAAKLMLKVNLNITQNANLNVDHLSSDLEVGRAYAADPLVHGKLTPRAFFEIYNEGIRCIKQAENLKYPALVTHGGDDKIISIEGSKEFASIANTKFHEFPSARHEPHNEPNKEDVIQYWIAAINEMLGA